MFKYYFFLYLGALLTVFAQLLLKKGASRGVKRGSLIHSYLNWQVFLGYILFLITIFLTLYAFRKVDLSEMVIVQPLIYTLVVVLSVFLFKERLAKVQTLGIFIVILGIIIFRLN